MSKRQKALIDEFKQGKISRRQFITRAAAFGLSMSVISSILAACAPAPTPTPTVAPMATPVPPTATPVPAPTPTPTIMAPKKGGTIKIARSTDAESLDPAFTCAIASAEVIWQIHDPLALIDEKTQYPNVATNWEVSDEGKTVTFTLRDGVKFGDGTPCDAEVAKWSLERMIDPEVGCPCAFTLGPIESIEVIDRLTFAVHWPSPFAPLWGGFAGIFGAVMSKDAVTKLGQEHGRKPGGTGAFKVVEWRTGESLVLERNDYHNWGSPLNSNQGVAYLDGAEYVVLPEDATRIAALETGEVDMIAGTAGVPPEKVAYLESLEGVTVVKRVEPGTWFLHVNAQMPPFDNVKVRQALMYAIDKQKLVDLVYAGYAEPAHSPLPRAYGAYYDPSLEGRYDYDLEKAKQLMNEAGVTSIQTKLLAIDQPAWVRVCEVVQEDLRQINIDAVIDRVPLPECRAKMLSGEYGLGFNGYAWPDPDLLYVLLYSDAAVNWSFYNDPELDALLDAQREATDPDRRAAIWKEIQQRVMDSAQWCMLYSGFNLAAYRDYVHGVTLSLAGYHTLQDIWLDKT